MVLRDHTIQARLRDAILFVCAQGGEATWLDWYQAIEDQFFEFSEGEKRKLVDAVIAMVERARSPVSSIAYMKAA